MSFQWIKKQSSIPAVWIVMGMMATSMTCTLAFHPHPLALHTIHHQHHYHPNKELNSVLGMKSRLFQSSSSSNEDDTETTTTNTSLEEEDSNVGTWNPLRLAVLKLGFTELRFTSPLNYEKREGKYVCANCGSQLFDSYGKYDSKSGWPSFWKTTTDTNDDQSVALKKEWDGRIECSCQKCGGHLGHVFPDGPYKGTMSTDQLESIPPTDPSWPSRTTSDQYTRLPRFCINGASLKFIPSSTN